jgi:hypothetical protein
VEGLLNNLIDIIFLCLSFVKKQRVLAGREAKALMDRLLEVGFIDANEFKPSGVKLYDVEFI